MRKFIATMMVSLAISCSVAWNSQAIASASAPSALAEIAGAASPNAFSDHEVLRVFNSQNECEYYVAQYQAANLDRIVWCQLHDENDSWGAWELVRSAWTL